MIAKEIYQRIQTFGINEVEFQDIIAVLKAADDMYHNGAPLLLTDDEYDNLKQIAHTIDRTHPYFLNVGSAVRGRKVRLPVPMGSLTQAYQGNIENWITKHSLAKQEMILTEKLDGVSVLIVYGEGGRLQTAYSRGDGIEGADITRHISKIRGVPIHVASRQPMIIRAEAIISKDNFRKIQVLVKSRSGQPYKNARNMIAGVMNAETNPDIVYNYIDVVAYEIISPTGLDKRKQLDILYKDNQFIIPAYVASLGMHLTDDNTTKILNKLRNESVYEIDGVVIEVNLADLRKKINPTKNTLNPEYARKYKVADVSNVVITTVIGVEWNVSKDGYLKPRVKIEPVNLVGVTVQHVTGFNAKFIVDNGIGPGAKVKITRAGDVVPYIMEVVEMAEKADMPDVETVWNNTGVDLVVKDTHQHDCVKFKQLDHFFSTLDAPYLREGMLERLFNIGFTEPEDIIELTVDEISVAIGSKVMGKKIFKGLREKLTNVPVYTLMGAHSAFGRGVGVRKMKKLYEAFEGDVNRFGSFGDIVSVDGFDEKTAKKIVQGLPNFKSFLDRVSKYITLAPYQAPKSGNLSGKSFVFTGFRSKELEQKVVEAGGKMSTSVSKNTSYVVADDTESVSGKATKAQKNGVPIISIAELEEMLS